MKHFVYCLSILLFTNSFNNKLLVAQNNQSLNAAEILQAIERLNTVGSVLYIAAHPDDENTRLLAYLSKERKLRTGYLSLTRGDGGQNLIGKEQGDALGLIRTEELLAARRVDGAEQFFTRANDFGFSKNPEETLKIWDKDSVLADVVWRIRKFKPDVIVCRFPTTGEGGHGHHTASAILAMEAFDAAADPKRFPEQMAYVEPWQATRIFWNTFNFGSTNTTSPDQLKINVGLFNPLIGEEYGEIAAESRSMHKSQGFGSAKARGEIVEYFKYLKGNSPANTDLFDGIDQTWKRVKNTAQLQELIEGCIRNFDLQRPQNSLKVLAEIHKNIQQLDGKDAYVNYWKAIKLKETENLLLACAGVWTEAAASDYMGIPGNSVNINVQLIKRNEANVRLNKIYWSLSADTTIAVLPKQNELYSYKHNLALLPSMSYSDPYWLRQPHEAGLYHVANQQQIGLPENAPALVIGLDLEIEGVSVKNESPLVYKYTDPVKGEIYRPFEVLPPVTVNVTERVYVFNGKEPKPVKFIIKANEAETDGVL